MTKRVLTFEQAQIIRRWRKQDPKKYTQYKLAEIFKVHHTTIQAILERRIYKVEDEQGNRIKLDRKLKKAIDFVLSHSKFYSRKRGQMLRAIAKIHNVDVKTVRRLAYNYDRHGCKAK